MPSSPTANKSKSDPHDDEEEIRGQNRTEPLFRAKKIMPKVVFISYNKKKILNP